MKITVSIARQATTSEEAAVVSLSRVGLQKPYTLDIGLSSLFDKSLDVPTLAFDFLFITSIVYAIDKMIDRASAEDGWTRVISVSIPVKHLSAWRPLSREWSKCVSFLTGDRWTIQFEEASRKIAQRNKRKRRKPTAFSGDAVSLLSGGLDSYIGAIDWLNKNRTKKLILVGHHDRFVRGPMTDQSTLFKALTKRFHGRVDLVQPRAGLSEATPDMTLRSRSLVFLGLGVYVAELLGPGTPVFIPENGPIALNIPLSASRRGSCSTRTVHPRFMRDVNSLLTNAGLKHDIVNPYAFMTKGEMVKQCRVPRLLAATHQQTVSCAKASHTVHWKNRTAGACGRCVPCLFRRAALHVSGIDTQPYGFDVLAPDCEVKQYGEDFRALLRLLHRNPAERAIAQELMCNGPIPREQLVDAVAVIRRMIDEMRLWLSQKASPRVKKLAGISR